METNDILARYSFFHQLSSEIREAMLHSAGRKLLEPGTPYFSEGDACSSIALIGSGSVVVYKVGENGRSVVLYRVGPGQLCILSTSCLLSAHRLPAFARTESRTEAILFPAPLFREWIDKEKVLRAHMLDTLASRMQKVITLVEEIAFGRIDRRLAELLVVKFENNGVPLTAIACTHESIAAEMGTAREVVSRVLKKFEFDGVLRLSRAKVYLGNAALLKSLAEMM